MGCGVVKNREGFLVDTCTGEVVGFDNYDATDFTPEPVGPTKKRTTGKRPNTKKVVLDYLLSIMDEREKQEFFRILDIVERYRKADTAYYLAIYEHVITKEGKQVRREYLKFLKVKGIGRYAVRQRKKVLRKLIREDPVVRFIEEEYDGDKALALRVYELLKKRGIAVGSSKKRKEVLLRYLGDRRLLGELMEAEKVEEMRNTLLLLSIGELDGLGLVQLPV